MFGQTFAPADLAVIGLLVVLEGVLSIDNALVLGLLARRLPKPMQSRALTYGLAGAFIFRLIAITTASFLLQWRIVKFMGGAYLVWVSVKHFWLETKYEEGDDPASPHIHHARFWPTVLVIELTDIAFAVDSILAAIALVGSAPPGTPEGATHPKLWVILIGGFIGVLLMRVAAVLFIRLLEKFPRFEMAAYLLVIVIGAKLLADFFINSKEHPHKLDFHSPGTAEFWVFWVLMGVSFCVGFVPRKRVPIGP